MPGVPIDQIADSSQEVRNRAAERFLELCLREMFEFRMMQTDPNWSNFLFEKNTERVGFFLLAPPLPFDFGGSQKSILVDLD